jgi:CBS domain-containing protein
MRIPRLASALPLQLGVNYSRRFQRVQEKVMENTSRPLMSLRAADIMSRSIVMIPREMSLQGAARLLTGAGVTGAPVIDDQGRCIGVLSATDFMHAVETQQPQANPSRAADSMPHCAWEIPEGNRNSCLCVADFMTIEPVLVGPTTPIAELARMMKDAHIHRIIIAEMATGRPLGIVSSMDILAAIARVDNMPRVDESESHQPHRAVFMTDAF